MIKYTRSLTWKENFTSKTIKIARTEDNHETREYYKYTHPLEVTYQELSGVVDVTIDIDAIVDELVRKAARNRSGRAIALNGWIVAKRRSRIVEHEQKKHNPIPAGYTEAKNGEIIVRLEERPNDAPPRS